LRRASAGTTREPGELHEFRSLALIVHDPHERLLGRLRL
jgi:hypothetical protein